jgi:hypothetical protein
MKQCTKCLKEKQSTDFYSKRGKPRSICKSCEAEARKVYRKEHGDQMRTRERQYYAASPTMKANKRKHIQAHKEQKRLTDALYHRNNKGKRAAYRKSRQEIERERYLKRKYGIDLEKYNQLLEEQFGLCAICLEEKPLHVDHDHKTGIVRGLLCSNCNTAVGLLKDDALNIQGAINYLEKFFVIPKWAMEYYRDQLR